MEPLEERQLLAVLSWDGEGQDGSWHNRFNWEDDRLPTSGDDVVIGPDAGDVYYSSGQTTVDSIISDAPFHIEGGTLIVLAASAANEEFTIRGGGKLVVNAGEKPDPASFTADTALIDQGHLESKAGGELVFPELYSLTRGSVIISGTGNLNAPKLTNIDNTRFVLSGNAQLSLPATTYTATGIPGEQTLFSVNGPQTRLELPNLRTIDDRWNDGNGNTRTHWIRATGGGQIELSSVESVSAPYRGEDRLEFETRDGGQIELGALREVSSRSGQVQFDWDQDSVVFPFLESLANTTFALPEGSDLTLDALTAWTTSSLDPPTGGTWKLPKLRTFTSSTLTLGADETLAAPNITIIDNSQFFLSGGAQLALQAVSYSATQLASNRVLFSAEGTATTLDLSSLRTIQDGWNDSSGTVRSHAIKATDGGRIKLGQLESIAAPAPVKIVWI